MLKNIRELTKEEAEQILEFVYPERIKYNAFKKFTFNESDHAALQYHNGQDNCSLYFTNTKLILWLHKHGYEITKLLENIAHYSEQLNDFDNLGYYVYELSLGEKMFADDVKHKWTLEYVINKCKKVYNEIYLKEY